MLPPGPPCGMPGDWAPTRTMGGANWSSKLRLPSALSQSPTIPSSRFAGGTSACHFAAGGTKQMTTKKCNPCPCSKCYPCVCPLPSPTLPPLVPRGGRETNVAAAKQLLWLRPGVDLGSVARLPAEFICCDASWPRSWTDPLALRSPPPAPR